MLWELLQNAHSPQEMLTTFWMITHFHVCGRFLSFLGCTEVFFLAWSSKNNVVHLHNDFRMHLQSRGE